ncbi:gas vesicle protein GvpO [Catenulispora subtropica]|uniref:Gas vesicle synthesis family protein n=1 Tax=Catenulispora subtropica TaxID=450798 RepID=A0ABN2RMD3_9ACTN
MPEHETESAASRGEKKTTGPARRRQAAEPKRSAPKRSERDHSERERSEPKRSARRDTAGEDTRSRSRPRSAGASAVDARKASSAAARYAQELTGRRPESITSLERTDDGWQVGVEVVESRRIPDSTDILAVYQIALDRQGDLVSYRRESRYHRGRVERSSDE